MYELIARFNDSFLTESAYNSYVDIVSKDNNKGVTGIDLGCGKGNLSQKLYKAGYKMIAADNCTQMLNSASDSAKRAGLNIRFLNIDLNKTFKLPECGFITAACDVVNHVKNTQRFFISAFSALKEGGNIYFDISSEYKLKTILENNTFTENQSQYSYIWNNKYDKTNNRIEMDFTLFEMQADGLYRRSDGQGVQYVHSQAKIIDELALSGFTDIKCFSAFDGTPTEKSSQRIYFTARKESANGKNNKN